MPKNSETFVKPKGEANPSKSASGSSEAAHEWRWHATGAGMGWVCDKCDGHHRFTRDEDSPPERGCTEAGSVYWQNAELTHPESKP